MVFYFVLVYYCARGKNEGIKTIENEFLNNNPAYRRVHKAQDNYNLIITKNYINHEVNSCFEFSLFLDEYFYEKIICTSFDVVCFSGLR